MRHKLLLIVAVLAQISALLWMVYGRETVIANGLRITLATAPIDPRDPFRGDFVRLRYPMNSFANAPVRWTQDDAPARGDIVHAVLEETYENEFTVTYFTTERPDGGVFLRGRRSSSFNGFSLGGLVNSFDVRFGIEQFYVEQDSGLAIEERQGVRGGMQNAMHMEVAVDDSGTAVITGYRWSDIAIQLEVTERFNDLVTTDSPPASDDSPDNASLERTNDDSDETSISASEETDSAIDEETDLTEPHARVIIQNTADEPVTLNNPGDNCGFLLELVGPGGATDQDGIPVERLQPANDGCTDGDISLLTLAPGDTHEVNIDLTKPRWQLAVPVDTNTNSEARDNADADINATMRSATLLDLRSGPAETALYRVVYRASRTPSATAELWQGDIVSQTLGRRGLVD